jgi:branched-subunit amino acid aminotransferase/4-amino-4-deoxychorismate lyase
VTAEGAAWVWLDGRILPEAEATIPVADRGFVFGDGLFETLRGRRRRVFRLGAHLDRLARGAAAIGLAVPGGIEDAVQALLESADLEDGALRVTLTRGRGAGGLRPPSGVRPTLVVTLRPAPSFEVGTPLAVRTSDARVLSRSPLAGLKTLGYLTNVTALLRAAVDDAIMLDDRDRVAQGSSSNLFWVTAQGELRTPSTACGIRLGVTREVVFELANAIGVDVREGEWPAAKLEAAREAFATSSLRGVAPIGSLDGKPIGGGGIGTLTRRIADDYRRLFERETS